MASLQPSSKFNMMLRQKSTSKLPCEMVLITEEERSVIDELRSGKYELSLGDFESVWYQFDLQKTGYIDVEDVDRCIRRILANVTIPSFSPYQETITGVLRKNCRTLVHVHDISVMIPLSGEMFARYYRTKDEGEQTSSVYFMKLWRQFDSDANGYLDREETSNLVRKIFAENQKRTEKKYGLVPKKFVIASHVIAEFISQIFTCADLNKDGKIQLRELAKMLNVESNFLDIDPRHLQQKQLGEIFGHYDKDDSGCVEGPEFLAFVRDVLRIDAQPLSRESRRESDVNPDELELAGDMILGLVDDDKDGKLDRKEMGAVMEKRHPKLIKNSTMFLDLQASFDRGEI